MVLEDGTVVKVHYTGKFPDGVKFDSTEGKDPIEFTIGKKMVVPGFEKAVKDMKEGEEKDVVIPPEEAYGVPNPELKKELPKGQFPKEIRAGMIFTFNKDDKKFFGKIEEIKEETVMVDFNHPLAGKELHFHLKLVGAKK